MPFSIDLTNQVAVVTGGAGEIGASIARNLTMANANVALLDYKEVDEAASAIHRIAEAGNAPLYFQCDIRNAEARTAAFKEILERWGRIDVLINNAAMPSPVWNVAVDANIVAPFELAKMAAVEMKKRHYGRIINITSSAFVSGGSPIVQYCTTKGGLDALTRFLAKELAPEGILVNSVAPGPVLTEMIQMRYSKEEFFEHYLPQMPGGHCLLAEDIANTVLFLSSTLCSGICGQMLLCDGGRLTLSVK